MEYSKIQVVALSILTTIITQRFLIDNHQTTIPTTVTQPQVVASAATSVSLVPSPLPTVATASSQNDLILKELVNLRKDMTTTLQNIQAAQPSNTQPLPTLNPSLLGGMVKINSPQWKRLDVYEKTSTSSKIVNTIVYDAIYFYRQKTDGWYQLDLDGGQLGWVQSQFLREYP